MLWLFAGFVFNIIVGAGVLAAIDRDGRLFDWYKSAPNDWLKGAVLILWPLVVIGYFSHRL